MTTGLCEVHFKSTSDLLGFFLWAVTTGAIFLLFSWFTWNPNKYALFRERAMFIPQRLAHSYMTILIGLYAWSAFRVWFCDNWDVNPTPLIIYVIKIIFVSWISLTFMVARDIWLTVVVAFIALAFAIANCVLFFIEDSWAGLVGVVDICTITLILLKMLYLGWYQHDVFLIWERDRKNQDLFIVGSSNLSKEAEIDSSEEKPVNNQLRHRTPTTNNINPNFKLPPPLITSK